MPDLTIQNARWCITNEVDEKNIGDYTQTYHKGNPGPYSVNWACTCKGYQFRKTCKHIVQAEAEHCGYGWEAAAGSPAEMGKTCPSCGGPTTVMSYAA